MLPHITKGQLAELAPNLKLYRKKTLTRAMRMEGAFEVATREGISRCSDGYVALDDQGRPYPIPRDEFELSHEEV